MTVEDSKEAGAGIVFEGGLNQVSVLRKEKDESASGNEGKTTEIPPWWFSNPASSRSRRSGRFL